MSRFSGRGWRLTRTLTVTAGLLVAALPVEGAVQLVQQSQEPEKPVSCTVAGASQQRVTRDRDIQIPDGPRVAARERARGSESAPGSDPDKPHVCPLRPEQEPVPPRDRP